MPLRLSNGIRSRILCAPTRASGTYCAAAAFHRDLRLRQEQEGRRGVSTVAPMIAGARNVPNALILPYRLELVHSPA